MIASAMTASAMTALRRLKRLAAAAGLATALAACAGDADLAPVDPLTVAPPDSPNWALAAPESAATTAERTRLTARYAATPEALLTAFDEAVTAQPRVTRTADAPLSKTYVQRSLIFRFPDVVTARALDLGDGTASLALYSRSLYGYSDLGVNAERLDRWIAALDARRAPLGP